MNLEQTLIAAAKSIHQRMQKLLPESERCFCVMVKHGEVFAGEAGGRIEDCEALRLFEQKYTLPRVAPPCGTPCLVWEHDQSKTAARLAMSTGVLTTCRGYECLQVTISGFCEPLHFHNWSVLVEKDDRGGM